MEQATDGRQAKRGVLHSSRSARFHGADEPFRLFSDWFKDAEAHEPNDPNAMAVATVDPSGLPNVRMVLLKHADADGFVFYTNYESAKGRELLASGKAALLFHWKSLRRQVRVRGTVGRSRRLRRRMPISPPVRD